MGYIKRLRAHARGGVPPLRRWGALRTEPPLRMSTFAADGRLLRGWGDIGDRAPLRMSTFAADGRLLRAWEALRTEPPLRMSAYAVNDEPRGALFSTVPY